MGARVVRRTGARVGVRRVTVRIQRRGGYKAPRRKDPSNRTDPSTRPRAPSSPLPSRSEARRCPVRDPLCRWVDLTGA